MTFYGYHGLYPEEKRLGQKFLVDLTIYANLNNAGESDKMEDSIHYGEIYNVTKRIVEGQSYNLVEAVAERVAQSLLAQFDKMRAVTVKVEKPGAPIPGHFDHVAVEIYREKSE